MNDEYRYCECSNGHRDVLHHPRLGVDICTQCGGVIRPRDEDDGKKSYDEPHISKDEFSHEDSSSVRTRQHTPCISKEEQRNEYSKKAWDSYMGFKEEEALHYIDLALDLDKSNSNNWNKKAIILEAMKRYKESEYCYDMSLDLSFDNLVCDNKVRMLYDWTSKLIEEAKNLPNGLKKLEEAKEINMRAITSRPGENSEEDLDKYLGQRDTINSYIDQEKEYQRNLETLKTYSRDELFGIIHKLYTNNVYPAPGTALKLVKLRENNESYKKIAVYAGDEKIGYVATYTKSELYSSASELQDKIQNTAEGIYLPPLQRYGEVPRLFGRIIKYEEDLDNDQEKECQRNLETLKTYPKEELFTIAGRNLYKNNIHLTPNMPLKLVKEQDNEYDKNAIAVYAEDEKIGYVANGDNTTCEFTTDANGLEYLPEITDARYIMNYRDSYHVARIIKDRYINLRLANRYKRKEEYSKALDCYNEVLELNPDDEYCLNRKPELLCLLKRWDEALKFYDIMGNWSGKASVFIEMGNYEDAFNCYDAIDDWYGKAIVLIHMGRYEEVLECCDKLAESPFYVRNLRDIGMLLIRFERYEEAVECLDRALSKSPNEPSVLSLMDYALSCLEEEIGG